jgi:3-hydroxyacyl-[acyl-carrier-protein] dehydratase
MDGNAVASWIDHQAIKRLNPQRYPLALLDRIEQQADGELVGIKAITATEPCYRFVSDDMDQAGLAYPSPLIAESFCQAAGPLCLSQGAVTLDQAHDQVMVIASMSDIVFLRPVFPGQVITHHPRLLASYSNAVLVGGETRQAGEPVARFGGILVAWSEKVRL